MSSIRYPYVNSQQSSSTTASTSSGSFTDLITLSSLSTIGFPVEVSAISGSIFAQNTGGANAEAEFRITRDGTEVALFSIRSDAAGVASNYIKGAAGSLRTKEISLADGSYVYKLQGRVVTGTSAGVIGVALLAEEHS
jgi:hypothetical protein